MKNILQQAYLKKRLSEVESYLQEFLDFEPKFISERALFNLKAGGKRLRPAFVILSADYFNHHDDYVLKTAAIMELIHMSSLIHDDINDHSSLRRGQITINSEYSNDVATNVGDYILIKALRHVYDVKPTEAVLRLIIDTAIEMAKGEVAQLRSVFDLNQTMVDYYYRIERKTAILIAICCQVGAVLSGASKEEENIFYDYGYHLGMAFQMKDDLLDLMEQQQDVGKPTGQDLANGLLNLPVILLLEKDFEEKDKVKALIQARFPGGQKDLDWISDLLRREGCLEDSEAIIMNHIDKAKSVLDNLADKPILNLMRQGADYIYERSH